MMVIRVVVMLYDVQSVLELVVINKVAHRTEPLSSVVHFMAPPGIERAKHQHTTLGGNTDIGSNVGENVPARWSKYVNRLYKSPAGVLIDKRGLDKSVYTALTAMQLGH